MNIINLNNDITRVFKTTPILYILKLIVIYYIIFVSFRLNKELLNLFDNVYFRVLMLVCIFYSISIDTTLGILFSVAYINSINTLHKIKMNDLLNVNNIDYLSSEDFETK